MRMDDRPRRCCCYFLLEIAACSTLLLGKNNIDIVDVGVVDVVVASAGVVVDDAV